VPLVPLFMKLMKDAGAGDYDDVALSRRIGTYTGGINLSLVSSIVHPEGVCQSECLDGEHMMTKLFFRGKSTSDKVDELLSIMNLMLTQPKLDSKSKAIENLRESKARMESSIVGAGHQYANSRLRSRYDAAGYIQEKMGGISYLDTVKELLKQAEEDWPTLLKRLETMREKITNERTCRKGVVLNLTGDEQVFETITPVVDKFLAELPGDKDGEELQNFYKTAHPWIVQAKSAMSSLEFIDEGFVVPTQVSYVGQGGKIYEVGEPISGSSAVVSRFLKTGYLWDYVRVIGGAYGGFCTFSPDVGFFSYLSYRDPNLSKTIDVYDNTSAELIKSAEELEKNPEALETAIIGAMGDMDSALGPDQKGWVSLQRWISGETPEQRQKWRDEVLETKAGDFTEFAKRLEGLKDSSTMCVISSKSAFETAAKEGKEMKLIEVL
jgi:Zn-dependent M16 (insulinase) family peptidase